MIPEDRAASPFIPAEAPGDPDALSETLAAELDLVGIERPADRAYHGIRRAILSGALPGGTHLVEEALARMTGTSRTPVREALRRIVGEGLALDEGRSRFVAEFPFEEVAIVFDIRARLESYAARVAAERIGPAELGELARIIDDIDALAMVAPSADMIQRFADLNSRFHACIINATQSPQMQNLSARATSIPLEMIKQFVWSQQVNIARSNQQHRDIHAALSNGNAPAAEALMAAHILSTRPNRPIPADASAAAVSTPGDMP